jgi:hypothetical protein
LRTSDGFFDSLLETRREKGGAFTVLRPSLGSNTVVRMRRGALPANNDYYGCMLDDSTAYIWFGSFTHQTYSKISRYVNEFCFNHHAPMLIIDLRSNGGGTLSDAIDLANLFSTRKDTIITLQSHAHGHEQIFRTTTTDTYKNVKIAVLVNENTASASEVFAGVMQDWDRAVIIGQPTHGKGLVMTPYELNNGTVIEPVSYEYRLPSGRCIQKPYVGRFLSDPVPGSPTIFFNYTHRYEQAFRCDSHIYHSRKLNRPLWGNMGIIPDVFVGGWSTNFAFEGIEYDALRNIWFGFLTRYQKTLTAHSTIGEFLLDFPIKESTIWVKKAFQSYPNSHPLDVNAFTKNLAVFLGQRCFTLSSQSPAMLRQDDYVQVAMQVLREEDSKSERTNQKRKTKLSNDVSLSER